MTTIKCPKCNNSRVNYIAKNVNIVYLQSELINEWYTPNLTTKDIQANLKPVLFECVKCKNEWKSINE